MTSYYSSCVPNTTDSSLCIIPFSRYNCRVPSIHYHVFTICCLLCIVYCTRFTVRDSLLCIVYVLCTSGILYSDFTIQQLFAMSLPLFTFIVRIYTIYHSLLVINYFELTIQYSLLDICYLRFTLHHVPCTLCDVISYFLPFAT